MSETTAPYGTGPAASSGPARRVRIHHLREMKERGEKFAMLTAYEQYAAQTFDEAGIPVLLVGDSASNNVYGNETSLPVTVDELVPLVRAVTRAAKRALVVAEPDDVILVAGTTYVVGRARSILRRGAKAAG